MRLDNDLHPSLVKKVRMKEWLPEILNTNPFSAMNYKIRIKTEIALLMVLN